MNARLKIYNFRGVLRKDFSTLEKAQKVARRISQANPTLLAVPYLEKDKRNKENIHTRYQIQNLDHSEMPTQAVDRGKIDTSSWDEEISEYLDRALDEDYS